MAQQIKQGNIFGRIGSGIGKGIAEKLPEEIQRGRLASGLQQHTGTEEGRNLPLPSQLGALFSLPGSTPQMQDTFGKLLRQQSQGQALANYKDQQNKPVPFPTSQSNRNDASASDIPSITKGPIQETLQEGFTPRTEEEKFAAAGQAYNANPAFFKNDPQLALDLEDKKDLTNQNRFLTLEAQNARLSGLQSTVKNNLQRQYERLGGNVPAELYSDIESKAIQATRPRSEGGRGLTEEQAMREFGDELNASSKKFAKIGEIGNWAITTRPANETLRAMKSLQKDMKEIGQSDNYAKRLVSEVQISPKFAHAIAEPVSNVPSLNKFISTIPELKRIKAPGISGTFVSGPNRKSVSATLDIAPRLAEFVSKNEEASPLAISYEIEKKGYNPQVWLQYLTDNADRYNMKTRQADQLDTPLNPVAPLNDLWLSSFSGLE